ncbi:hypothetical protein AB0J77_14710 [Micromonospora tulbaghiae]|uniref:hypothetical protein n=1 Tax=Micromonospora tulbaghiae TaxID=479978 RepID=UPI003416A2D6
MTNWVWMKHPEGTEAAPFAPDAVEFWQARGWEPTDKPEEPDPTAEPRREAPASAAERAAENAAGEPPVEKTTPKTAGRQRRANTEES